MFNMAGSEYLAVKKHQRIGLLADCLTGSHVACCASALCWLNCWSVCACVRAACRSVSERCICRVLSHI